jgi:hypothetical protein
MVRASQRCEVIDLVNYDRGGFGKLTAALRDGARVAATTGVATSDAPMSLG